MEKPTQKPKPEIIGRCQFCHAVVRGNKTAHSYRECGSRNAPQP